MRIDKFLKVSHLIKRRTVATEACRMGRILLNGRQAKAGSSLKIGDRITILYGHGDFEVRVLALPQHIKKAEASSIYEILENPKATSSQHLEENLASSIGVSLSEADEIV